MGAHALVLGGGLAGLLAASVLIRHADAVTVIERDRLPDGPVDRKGTPQMRQTHLLPGPGARLIDGLVPGFLQRVVDRGAQRVSVPDRWLLLASRGWHEPLGSFDHVVSCRRRLLDWVLRELVLADGRITVVEDTDVVGLAGDVHGVTGVHVRHRGTGQCRTVPAGFVVDATGASSAARDWLARLGCSVPADHVVDGHFFGVTRVYRMPDTAVRNFPLISVLSDPAVTDHQVGGGICPVEDRLWSVNLLGSAGHAPPTDENGFSGFLRDLRHPLLADLLETAQPVTSPRGFRLPANRRRPFHRMSTWPDRLAVLGDAACVTNPFYIQGMTQAALGAVALDRALCRHGLERGTRAVQRAICRTAGMAWEGVTRQDLRFPATVATRRPPLLRWTNRLLDRMYLISTTNAEAMRAGLAIASGACSPVSVLTPRLLLTAVLGPRATPPAEPFLTAGDLLAHR